MSARDIVEWLRERIRRGRFVPGQRPVEADIIRETGATRSRVREAIQRLVSEGLVVVEEFRGASVKQFSIDELRQGEARRDPGGKTDPVRYPASRASSGQ